VNELFVYKVLTAEQFDRFKAEGVFKGAPVDLADGYIHMSTRDQAAETVARHFAGQDRLVMVDLAPLGSGVKWEVSRGGALFPHLYGDLPWSAVAGKVVLRIGDDGTHQFPAGF
jgi:uncharacterized protein (DUF952 family)